jgi:hypothetical protein
MAPVGALVLICAVLGVALAGLLALSAHVTGGWAFIPAVYGFRCGRRCDASAPYPYSWLNRVCVCVCVCVQLGGTRSGAQCGSIVVLFPRGV